MRSFLTIIATALSLYTPFPAFGETPPSPLTIGWIGPMSGPHAKFAMYQAAQLAEEEINKSGGVAGRPLKILFEDGKGDGKTALSAAMKLVTADHVNFIVGGHSSPETLAIAPYLERSGVLMLASITSNPKLTSMGDLLFRVTAVSLQGADLIAKHIAAAPTLQRIAVIHEETDYAQPLAERMREQLTTLGRQVVAFQSYNPGESDFRSLLTKIRSESPQAIYLAAQSPDSTSALFQQVYTLGMKVQLFGNELAANSVTQFPDRTELFEGMIFAEPRFELNNPATADLIANYTKRYGGTALPAGIWTAEAYDAVRLLTSTIARCGADVQKVKECLYLTKSYPGASGKIEIDSNGDGVRKYLLKQIKGGKIGVLQ